MTKKWTEEETDTLVEAHGTRKAVLERRLGALHLQERKRACEAVVDAVGNDKRFIEFRQLGPQNHYGMGTGEVKNK